MSLSAHEIVQRIENLVQEFRNSLDQVSVFEDLEALRVEYLGRKGKLAQAMAHMRDLDSSERPEAGKAANRAKEELNALLDGAKQALDRAERSSRLEHFDPTLPGRTPWQGSLHPVTKVTRQICEIFKGLGFEVVSGPEVENDFYNFEALNIPAEHPARDMQDTLYISDSVVLRTHTSPLQVRTMQKRTPPVAAIAPGKVYRRDADLTHTPMFHQIEGFLVDREVSMADLRGTLTSFVHQIFTPDTLVRFRPSFFPFTEPSAEVDISCVLCGGTGRVGKAPCRVCKETGWVEILGCGMIDPAVFEAVDYDPDQYTGFAFGLGVERVAMLKYGIGDLRMFFENDLRFLRQFG
ncbi:MAG: phenylalanine--tRNA ligase subunit alpha [Thermodesulfobacteriota bacterium]